MVFGHSAQLILFVEFVVMINSFQMSDQKIRKLFGEVRSYVAKANSQYFCDLLKILPSLCISPAFASRLQICPCRLLYLSSVKYANNLICK